MLFSKYLLIHDDIITSTRIPGDDDNGTVHEFENTVVFGGRAK